MKHTLGRLDIVKALTSYSGLALLGAAACGTGCQVEPSGPGGTGQVELELAACGSTPDQIRACVSVAGVLRVITGTHKCLPAEKPLCWNQIGPQGNSSLATVTRLEVGDQRCVTGGSKLEVGVDDNRNGTLDPKEVDGFAYVCNGLNSLIRTTREPPGDNCANGGQKIESGLDANGDNVLDDSEVNASATAYVCNGLCPPGLADCDGNGGNGCETDITTTDNCGGCGVVCAGDTPLCDAGQCKSCQDVYAGELTCNGACVDPTYDSNNCGGCSVACSGDKSMCAGGQCVDWCEYYYGGRTCNGSCVYPDSDRYNCGGCGVVCPGSAPLCNAGQCVSCQDISPGTVYCNGSCVPEASFICTWCGNVCPDGLFCSSNSCQPASTVGLPTPDGWYQSGSYTGPVWTAQDAAGSTIELDSGLLCANGTAIQVPYDSDTGQYDYNAWGALLGWDLNHPLGGVRTGADLSAISAVTVGIVGGSGLNFLLSLVVEDPSSGATTTYCAPLPSGGGMIPLSSLTQDCWNYGGAAFDPATMQPSFLTIEVRSDPNRAYPFTFCVTTLLLDAVCTFDSLPYGQALSSYTESGITVTPTSGNWQTGGYIGFTTPAGETATGQIQVTAGGSAFRFDAVDLYSSITQIPYVFTGLMGSTTVFTASGTVPNTFGRFVTVSNPYSADLIDTLLIDVTNPPVCCTNPIGIDNIRVSK
jgi:hypothetical protein